MKKTWKSIEEVTYSEYLKAKEDIIRGYVYKESTSLNGDTIWKIYSTKKNGNFYEVRDGNRLEFWSSKYSTSMYYNEREDNNGR